MLVLKFAVIFGLILATCCTPTLYKRIDNDNLEPDMVAVSSTVIPLPVYELGYGVGHVGTFIGKNGYRKRYYNKQKKPEEPIELITIHTKKAAAAKMEKSEKSGKVIESP